MTLSTVIGHGKSASVFGSKNTHRFLAQSLASAPRLARIRSVVPHYSD